MEITRAQLAELVDKETLALDDGNTLRVRIEVTDIDAVTEINGVDCYGRVAWADDSHPDTWRGEPAPRPSGFTGAARKLHPRGYHIDSPVWWQPHETTIKQGPEAIEETAKRMTALLATGFTYVRLELLGATDAYGRPFVEKFASLGGIDSLDGGYLSEVLDDLLGEMGIEVVA